VNLQAVAAWATAVPSTKAHWLAVFVGLLFYILTSRIKRERRPPTAAVAWVLGIIALPYLVLPAYLLFGSRKLHRIRVMPPAPERRGEHWAQHLLGSFGLAPAAAVRAHLHQDGTAALRGLRDTIAAAKERLDVATFILGADVLGDEVVTLLSAKAQAGVRVRLLLDGMGTLRLPGATARKLRAGGVETAIFRPPFARAIDGPRNLRNHRKLTIADGRWLWAGGRNLAAEYFVGAEHIPAWRDLSFDLEGPLAADAAAQFEADWVASGGAAAALCPRCEVAEPNAQAQFVPSGPDQIEDTVHALLVDACYRAERRVLAVTPYFLPDESLENALRLAARRGVAVSLFLPAQSNHRLADFARSRSLRALAAAGVEIVLLPFMLHAKGVVVDDALALTGSVNLDLRSLLLNHESAVVFYNGEHIAWLAAWIEALRVEGNGFDASPPGLLRDFAEGLLLALAFQL
jgi:cardiolipin synthase